MCCFDCGRGVGGGRQQASFDVGSVLSTPGPVRSDFDMKAMTSFRSFLSLPPSEPPLSELRLGTSECPQVFLVGCQGGKAQGWVRGVGAASYPGRFPVGWRAWESGKIGSLITEVNCLV